MIVRKVLLVVAVSSAALLSAASLASASTTSPASSARSAHEAVASFAGDHESVLVGGSSAPRTAVTPDYQLRAVSPRVTCGGFNGNVKWSGNSIEIWGEVWDTCGGYTYVYLSWNNPTHHNQAVGVSQPHDTDGVSPQTFKGGLNVSNISVTACSTHGGWHCGKPVSM